jgi:hypothetical protein
MEHLLQGAHAAAEVAAEVFPAQTPFRIHSPVAQAVAAKFVFLFFKDVTGMSLNVVQVREIDSGSGRVCARSRNHT